MVNALTEFLVERAKQKKLSSPADLARATNLSRQVCWNWLTDDREKLTRLPNRSTLEAFAGALGVSFELLLGKAVEALGVGYTSGDFVNSVATASDRELLDEIERRLTEGGGAHAGSAAPSEVAEPELPEQSGEPSGPVPTSPTALRLLGKTDWDPSAALELAADEPDSAETAIAADEIRALIPLTPAELLAARRNAERPPPEVDEQDGD